MKTNYKRAFKLLQESVKKATFDILESCKCEESTSKCIYTKGFRIDVHSCCVFITNYTGKVYCQIFEDGEFTCQYNNCDTECLSFLLEKTEYIIDELKKVEPKTI